jgi:hypothetical protein
MTSTRAPLRITVIARGLPIASENIIRCRSWETPTGLPATVSSRSPWRRPARSAGPPATTCATSRPVLRPSRSRQTAGTGPGIMARPR